MSLVEILVVLVVMAILASIAMPGVLAAMRKGGVVKDAQSILDVAGAAQRLARHRHPGGPLPLEPHYGVAVVQEGGASYATLLYGDSADDEWVEDGRPVQRVPLSRSIEVLVAHGTGDAAPLAGRVAWFYQFGSGRPIAAPADQTPIPVGTRAQGAVGRDYRTVSGSGYAFQLFEAADPAVAASPVCSELSVRIRGGRLRAAVAIYPLGLGVASAY